MNKVNCTILLLLITGSYCISQTRINGKVTSQKNEALPFVNVFIKGSLSGNSTDNDGLYSFYTSMNGQVIITASFVGYQTEEKEINLSMDSIRMDFILKPLASSISEVVITAGSFEANDEKRNVVLRASDIGTIAGASGDIMGAIESLPGTQYNGESNGLFVRGGSDRESKVIIDEMVVQNPYYSPVPDIKQRGRFDPFMFSGTVFSTGGYSAIYGQALSSVLILKSKGLADSTNTGGGIHFYGGRLFHTHRWENSSVHAEINYNNMNPYHKLSNIDRYKESPENICGKLIFRQRVSEKGIFKIYTNLSKTKMIVDLDSFADSINHSSFDLKNNNNYFNTSYKEYFKNEEWSIFAGFSYSDDSDNALLDSIIMSENERLIQSKFILSNSSISSLKILSGFEFQYLTLNRTYENRYNEIEDLLSVGFVETNWQPSYNFATKIGIRYEYSDYLGKSNLTPRFSVAYLINQSNQVSFATGYFCQHPQKEYLYDSDISPDFESAVHLILNYQWNKNNKLFRIELFNKEYSNLIITDLNNTSIVSNDGYGYARGIELFWRDRETISGADYWISYSYLDTRRLYMNYPIEATPCFASNHNLNIVYKHWVPLISCMIGSTYNFSSGRPYYNPNREAADFHSDRTKSYNSVDLSLSWISNILNRRTVAYFSLTNILGRDNIFGYKYYDELNSSIPIKPVSKRSLFFGFFISTY